MSDVPAPETQHQRTERGRLRTRGRSTEDDSWCTLLTVQEIDSSWTVCGPAPGVRLCPVAMVVLGETILERAR